MKNIIKLAAVILVVLSASSCKKFLDIQPVGKVIPKTAADFRQLLTSGYTKFPSHKSLLAVRTDELLMNQGRDEFANYKDIYSWNDIAPESSTLSFPYASFYSTIFNANHVIAEVENEAGKTEETAQLKGEAYLLRAYTHFELVNLYAKPYNKATAATDRGIVMSLKIDLEQNYQPSTVQEVYTQILADITEGQKLLNVSTFEAGKNYRFTTRAALALSARVYEYMGDWQKALASSQQLLSLNNKLEDLNTAGSKLPNHYQSVENIMSLDKPFDVGVTSISTMSSHLIGIYDKVNDLRFPVYFRQTTVTSNVYVALKGNSDALKISFRNGEAYLIEAEAALQTDNMSLALQSLLALKAKRLKPAYYQTEVTRISALPKAALLQEILDERERELALEGQRWYDLRRYGQPAIEHIINKEVFTLQKNDPRYTLRFPAEARANNPSLQ